MPIIKGKEMKRILERIKNLWTKIKIESNLKKIDIYIQYKKLLNIRNIQ